MWSTMIVTTYNMPIYNVWQHILSGPTRFPSVLQFVPGTPDHDEYQSLIGMTQRTRQGTFDCAMQYAAVFIYSLVSTIHHGGR